MTRYVLAAFALALALTGVQTWRLERVKAELVTTKAQAAALAKRLEVADRDAQVTATACDAREANARQSAQTIERIVTRTRTIHVDPQGCAVRTLTDPDELRQALQPGLSAPAEPMH